jgi:hypothetical protein
MNKILDEFNNTLDEFMTKLINQFPDEKKLLKYYQVFKFTKVYDKSLPIKIFMSTSLSSKEYIKNRDDEYFLNNKPLQKRAVELSSFSSETGLQEQWKTLSYASKNAIWDYIQTLFVMGEMYVNSDHNAIEELTNIRKNFDRDEVNNIYNNNGFTDKFKSKIN